MTPIDHAEDWIMDSLEQDYLENLAELQKNLLFKQHIIEKQALKIQELELKILSDKQRLQKTFQHLLLKEYLHHQNQFIKTLDAIHQMRLLQEALERELRL